MQQRDHLGDDIQALLGHVKPGVECMNELTTDVLARMFVHVLIGRYQDLFVLRGPRPIFIFGAIHARSVSLMSRLGFFICGLSAKRKAFVPHAEATRNRRRAHCCLEGLSEGGPMTSTPRPRPLSRDLGPAGDPCTEGEPLPIHGDSY